MIRYIVAGMLLSLAVSAPALATPTWSLELFSAPGSFIGGGTNTLLLNQTSPLSFAAYGTNTIPPNYITVMSTSGVFFDLTISSRGFSQVLNVGEYDDASRAEFPVPGTPGLDIDFNGAGANTLTGSFDVVDLVYGGKTSIGGGDYAYAIESLSFTFTEIADGGGSNISGAFAFNSPLPSIPEPGTLGTLLGGIAMLVVLRVAARTWPSRNRHRII